MDDALINIMFNTFQSLICGLYTYMMDLLLLLLFFILMVIVGIKSGNF